MGELAYILQSRSNQWFDIIEKEYFGLHRFLQHYPEDFFISRENGSLFVSLVPPEPPSYNHRSSAYPSPYRSHQSHQPHQPYRHQPHHQQQRQFFPPRKQAARYQPFTSHDVYPSYASQDPSYYAYNEKPPSRPQYGDGRGRSNDYSLFDMYVIGS